MPSNHLANPSKPRPCRSYTPAALAQNHQPTKTKQNSKRTRNHPLRCTGRPTERTEPGANSPACERAEAEEQSAQFGVAARNRTWWCLGERRTGGDEERVGDEDATNRQGPKTPLEGRTKAPMLRLQREAVPALGIWGFLLWELPRTRGAGSGWVDRFSNTT